MLYLKRLVTLFCFLSFFSIFSNLFDKYPSLKLKIPYILLGNWPTSVKKLEVLSEEINAHIYLKDEGDCGALDQNGYNSFGGNKVRKLEFLLADAVSKGYTTVLTYGGYASNHMVATACYAQKLGLQSIGLLFKQNPPPNISRNLLLNIYFGAHIFECPQPRLLNEDEIASFLNEHNFSSAYVIPVGGSNKLGVLGIVSAVFELRDQIAQGLLPEPDFIYVPFGSMGTTAGLLLGIKLAGLKTKVRAIKVTGTEKYNRQNLCYLIAQTNAYLHELEESIPVFEWNAEEIDMRADFLGKGYAHATEGGEQALALFKELENISLDQTYTAKAADALVYDCQNHIIDPHQVILFWNSYCCYEYPDLKQKIDCSSIPEWMHAFI
jgi:D-cysteine desulfhydrase